MGEVWQDYIEQRRPFWGDLHYRDHIDKAKAGGLKSARRGAGTQLTTPGPLTLHGLRRSFKSLTEWLEVPVGVVAQIQGHKPSATAEKHYTVRPLELLRAHHERIEAWILEQAGIVFDAKATPGKLQAVA